MPLGIRPTVDFAFKKIFGSPEHSQALIGLLNAILRPEPPITSVEILNPFSYQEFAGDKQVVLDVRARDAAGRLLNVEMQVAIFSGLLERLVYYACRLFVDQLARRATIIWNCLQRSPFASSMVCCFATRRKRIIVLN
jgi:predicted transposase/invertase (TIGR01784 family)